MKQLKCVLEGAAEEGKLLALCAQVRTRVWIPNIHIEFGRKLSATLVLGVDGDR